MSVTEISHLPLLEKLRIMGMIWADLRQRADRIDVSPAQRELLEGRRARVKSGQSRILDWDSVKNGIGGV